MPAEPNVTTTRSPSVVGDAFAYQFWSQFVSFSEYDTSFCHRTLPSARAKQMRLRSLPPRLACVTKTLSPQTTGVELPWFASGTFHFTFFWLLPPHSTGTFFS